MSQQVNPFNTQQHTWTPFLSISITLPHSHPDSSSLNPAITLLNTTLSPSNLPICTYHQLHTICWLDLTQVTALHSDKKLQSYLVRKSKIIIKISNQLNPHFISLSPCPISYLLVSYCCSIPFLFTLIGDKCFSLLSIIIVFSFYF